MDSAEAMRRLQKGGDGSDWRNTAVVGYMEDDWALAFGYFAAAKHVVEGWKAGDRNDMLAVPILSLYRHGIELALKAAIREAAKRLRVDGHCDTELQSERLNDKLASTHSIGNLVQRLTAYLGRLHLGDTQKLPADTLETLNSLHVLDESGQTFRYSTVKVRSGTGTVLVPARADQEHVDIVTMAGALASAGDLILHGVNGVLGDYADWQQDMIEESRAWSE